MHCCLAKAGVVTEHAVELRPNEQRGREVNQRFVGTGTPYTPQPVNFYNR